MPEPEPRPAREIDPHAAIAEAEDPEAAARAALGLEDRVDEEELRPEEAAAILARATPQIEEAEEVEEVAELSEDAGDVVVEAEVDLASADLVDVYAEEAISAAPSPYDRAGAWYVVHTYSGYEKKVKSNLESRVKSLHMEGRIHEVVIPMDDVIEFKGGKKTVVQKKVFPGYLLVRMDLNDETWGAVRNTPGVTGFVGSGAKPTPLSRPEVESILRVRPEDETKKARPRLDYEVGDQVRVTAGPFADFNGLIDEINVDQSTLKVLVNIFGRETPVTLDFADVAKL
ncbi:MAG: transcription termination/antitermination protein NusG [Actinobacteria bacterium]|nr:transcription termination/antitermination protein NusG [Actinomycetota bacterium]